MKFDIEELRRNDAATTFNSTTATFTSRTMRPQTKK